MLDLRILVGHPGLWFVNGCIPFVQGFLPSSYPSPDHKDIAPLNRATSKFKSFVLQGFYEL